MAKDNPTVTEGKLRKEREVGFSVTNDRNAAVFGNLQTSLHGAGKRIGASNQRILGKMQNMRDRMALRGRQTDAAESELVARYGSEYGGVANQALRGRDVQDLLGRMQGRAYSDATNLTAQAGRDVVSTAQAGASEAQAAAGYATAQALASRTKEDVRLVAEMRHDIELEKIREAAAIAAEDRQWARQQTLVDQEAAKAETLLSARAPLGLQVASTLAPYSVAIRDFMEDNPGASNQEIFAALSADGGALFGETIKNPAVTHLMDTIRSTGLIGNKGAAGRTAEVQALVEAAMVTIASSYPDLAADPRTRTAVEARIRRDLRGLYGPSAAPPADPNAGSSARGNARYPFMAPEEESVKFGLSTLFPG